MAEDDATQIEQTIQRALHNAMDPLARQLQNIDIKLENPQAPVQNIANGRPPIWANHMLSLRPLQPFSGSFGDSFSEWVDKLDQYMVLQCVPDQADDYKKAFLEANLSSSALSTFRELKRGPHPPNSYADYIQQLKNYYPDGRDADVYQQLIYDREQKRYETVTEFLEQLRRFSRSAYPTLTDNARDSIIKPIFLRGLQTLIRDSIKFREFTTLEDALKAAQFAESQLFREDLRSTSHTADVVCGNQSYYQKETHVDNSKNMLSQIQLLRQEFEAKLAQLQSATQPIMFRCDICHRGHQTSQCKSPCRHCSQSGHRNRHCPLLKRQPIQQTVWTTTCISSACPVHNPGQVVWLSQVMPTAPATPKVVVAKQPPVKPQVVQKLIKKKLKKPTTQPKLFMQAPIQARAVQEQMVVVQMALIPARCANTPTPAMLQNDIANLQHKILITNDENEKQRLQIHTQKLEDQLSAMIIQN